MVTAPSNTASWSGGRRIDLRADGGGAVGYGHVMRCLTIGAALRKLGYSVSLISTDLDDFLASRALHHGITVTRLTEPAGSRTDAESVAAREPALLIVDGYQFGEPYFKHLDDRGIDYVIIDDLGIEFATSARLILNQNPHADASLYPATRSERLLLGLRFALIRGEILELGAGPRVRKDTEQSAILVAIGGTDVLNLGERVARRLAQETTANVVLASQHHVEGILAAPADIADALAGSTIAVIGAGSTLWEACYLGVPTIALVVADNQLAPALKAATLGLTHDIDCRTGCDVDVVVKSVLNLLDHEELCSDRASRAIGVVDGHGAERVAAEIDRVIRG